MSGAVEPVENDLPRRWTRLRRTHGSDKTWRLRDLLLVVGLGYSLRAAVLVSAGLSLSESALPGVGSSPRDLLVAAALSGATLTALVLIARRRGPLSHTLGLRWPPRRWAMATAGITAAVLAIKVGSAWIISTPISPLPRGVEWTAPGLDGWMLVGNLVVVGAVTAIEEEALFRGALYGWLRGLVPVSAAAVISALLFGLAHQNAGVDGILFAFGAGLIFVWLYERTGSLWPGVALHAASNAGSLLVVAVLLSA